MTLEHIHDYCIDTTTRTVYIHGRDHSEDSDDEPGIEYQMANRVIKNLLYLDDKSDKQIDVILHTCGGEWAEGMAIYDCVQSLRSPVVMYGYAEVRSMSSIVFMAADWRIMMPSTTMVLHTGESWYEGVSHGMASANEHNTACDNLMLDIYADACASSRGVGRDKVRKQIQDNIVKNVDWYLTAEEAVRWGLADSVYGGSK